MSVHAELSEGAFEVEKNELGIDFIPNKSGRNPFDQDGGCSFPFFEWGKIDDFPIRCDEIKMSVGKIAFQRLVLFIKAD